MIFFHALGEPSKNPSGVTTNQSDSFSVTSLATSLPDLVSQSLMSPSQLLLSKNLSSGLNETEEIRYEKSSRTAASERVNSFFPLSTSQTLTELCPLEPANVLPSWLKVND